MTARHNDRIGASEFPAMAANGPFAIYSGATARAARTLWQVFETTAKAFPGAGAIDDGQSVLSYRDLLSEARQAGYRLASRGIGAGDRIGIRMTSGSTELYVSILAVLSVGAAYVLVDMGDPDDRARLVWSAAGVRAIIGDGGELTWRTGRHRRSPARRPWPEDDAWIIFTSGPASTPQGVAVTHGNAAAFVGAEASLFLSGDPLGPGDSVLAACRRLSTPPARRCGWPGVMAPACSRGAARSRRTRTASRQARPASRLRSPSRRRRLAARAAAPRVRRRQGTRHGQAPRRT